MNQEINTILDKIKKVKKLDFTEYRESTIKRRVDRRLLFSTADTLEEYITLIEDNPAEFERLVHDLTIHVTEPFRDPDAWDALKDVVSRQSLVGGRFKIWSAGCARGDEAYSLASLCDEVGIKASIVGTDLEKDCIEHAQNNPGYQSEKQYITFFTHDLVSDGPFSKFDLIVCRNVLIYFSEKLQEKVLKKFYNSLLSGGILWLGSSETIRGKIQDRFESLNNKAKIFKRVK